MDSQRGNHSFGSVTHRNYSLPSLAVLDEIEQATLGCQIYPRQIVRDYINEHFVNLRNISL